MSQVWTQPKHDVYNLKIVANHFFLFTSAHSIIVLDSGFKEARTFPGAFCRVCGNYDLSNYYSCSRSVHVVGDTVYFITASMNIGKIDASKLELTVAEQFTGVADFLVPKPAVSRIGFETMWLNNAGVVRNNKLVQHLGEVNPDVERWSLLAKTSFRILVTGWNKAKRLNYLFMLDPKNLLLLDQTTISMSVQHENICFSSVVNCKRTELVLCVAYHKACHLLGLGTRKILKIASKITSDPSKANHYGVTWYCDRWIIGGFSQKTIRLTYRKN